MCGFCIYPNVEAHINSVDKNIKLTREDVKDNCLSFLDCDPHNGEDRSLHTRVYRKSHTVDTVWTGTITVC